MKLLATLGRLGKLGFYFALGAGSALLAACSGAQSPRPDAQATPRDGGSDAAGSDAAADAGPRDAGSSDADMWDVVYE